MKDKLIDEYIKHELDKYKESIDNVEVSSIFHDKLEDSLANLSNEQNNNTTNKKSKNKKLIIAASIAIALGVGTLSLPVLAENIPIINSFLQGKSIFEFQKRETNFGTDNPNLKEYTTKVNQSLTFNGITITVNEVAWDGNKLFVGYIIKGEKKLLLNSLGEPDVLSGYTNSINGKISGSGGYDFQKIDDKTYLLKEDINLSNDGKIPDKFRFYAKFTEVSGVKGNWEFDFIVSQKDFKDQCKTIKINKKHKIDNNKLVIKRLSLTPVSSLLEMSSINATNDNNHISFNNYEFLITNENGQLLKKIREGYRTEENDTYGSIEFIPDEINNSEKINIEILKKNIDILRPENYKTTYEIPLNNETLPKKITTKKFGSITINRFEVKDDKLTLYFSVEGNYSSLLTQNILIKNKSDDSTSDRAALFRQFIAEYNNKEYKNSIDFKNSKDELNHILKDPIIVIPDPSPYYEPLKGSETEVKIK
ncbi:DUF4179 domain-containing protein [Clostridium tetani]|uniref:DUF4179 domain-containing protein n=1 Tax=Clostridium tetani TaxID=1513 RepID=UPI0005142D0F|nr:DUF4179 domain-containing protein [Clostridium tetani]KGI38483.1 hypothetical protein LA33_09495 [Clostridium tetani ATCC 9441]SUY65630.1 RNA polymerase sigma factor-like protein [Clostridium tetani]